MYEYTKNWFYSSEIYRRILKYLPKNKKYNILEIGCYEGLSSCFFSDNLLDNEDSTMDCVDPFLNIIDNDHKDLLDNNEEDRFDNNIRKSKNFNKIKVHKITSDDFFKGNKKMYDFIYIDGCHTNECVKNDIENSYNFLMEGGIMWLDDYGGGTPTDNFRELVDNFINEKKCILLNKGYQVGLKK